MEDTKSKVLEFLTRQYEKTKFPFVSIGAITCHIGKYPRNELNQLFQEGKIRKRDCVRGVLIELIVEKNVPANNK